MLSWKNEEFGNLSDVGPAGKKGKGQEERSPWAGRNPVAACKIGGKGMTGWWDTVCQVSS